MRRAIWCAPTSRSSRTTPPTRPRTSSSAPSSTSTRTCPDVPVILDAKRGDVGNTAERYAIEAFERYGADAVTVNPYLGGDALEPFLKHADKGVIVLCRTSNPGGARPAGPRTSGRRSCTRWWRELAAARWNARGNCLLVVGATYPRSWPSVRALVGEMPLLVPGVGAQGGGRGAGGAERGRPQPAPASSSAPRAPSCTPRRARTSPAPRAAPPQALRETDQPLPPPRVMNSRAGALAALGCAGGARRLRAPAANDVSSVAVPPGAAILVRGGGPDPDSLDPQKARGFEAQSILRDLCEGLTTLDKARRGGAGRGAQLERERRRAHLHLQAAARGALVQRRSGGGRGLRRRPAAPGGPGHRLRLRAVRRRHHQHRRHRGRTQAPRRARRRRPRRGDRGHHARRARALSADAAVAPEHLPGAPRRRWRRTRTATRGRASCSANGAFVLKEWVQGSHILALRNRQVLERCRDAPRWGEVPADPG